MPTKGFLWFALGLAIGSLLEGKAKRNFSSFAIILTRQRELVALLLLSFECLVIVNVL